MAKAFDGKVVVVTGGSRGIGRATAKAFASEGAQLVLAAATRRNLEDAANDIAEVATARPEIFAADLTQLSGCEGLYAHVATRIGRCDVLVNAAGAAKGGAFVTTDDEAWQQGFALKFFACVRLCRLFWPMLKEAGGKVVNIAGGAGRTPPPEFLIGAATNAAMGTFSKGLSKLGMRDGVNVNTVTPGLTRTERVNDLMQKSAAERGISIDEAVAEAVARSGMRRLGEPADIAAAVLFLCSPTADHIQGSNLTVDGGATPGYY